VLPKRLETQRLSLHSWDGQAWQEFRSIATDQRVRRFISGANPWPDEKVKEFVERQREHERRLGYCLWKLQVEGYRQIGGFCGLQPLDDLPGVEIGWWLRPELWGKGFATEAGRAVLAEGFGPLKLDRIVAVALKENVASLRVMEKLGMKYEGQVWHHGYPVVLYAIEKKRG
jgi:RimJ/RimL family protein N-acetyltransferase